HPGHPGDVRKRVADDRREHAGQRHGRNREYEHRPEQPSELRGMVAVAVSGVVAVTCGVVASRVTGFGEHGVTVSVRRSHVALYTPTGYRSQVDFTWVSWR